MEWIPIKERTPDKTGAYLVTVRYKGVFKNNVEIAQWEQPEGQLTFDSDIKGKWKWMAQEDVIAWMPVPECYKEN